MSAAATRKAQREQALALVRVGMTDVDAATAVGVSHTSVGRWRVAAGIDRSTDQEPETGGETETWYTPPGFALLATLAVLRRKSRVGRRPLRVLCPTAGAGVFARAVRALEPDAVITAVEPRAEEIDNLRTVCDEVVHGALAGPGAADLAISCKCTTVEMGDLPVADLIIDNPPFSWFGGRDGRWLGFFHNLARGGLLALVGPSQWGQAAGHREALEQWRPTWQLRATGRVQYSEGGGPLESSLWVWTQASPDEWRCSQLPAINGWHLRWRGAKPGAEPMPAALVAEIRQAFR